MAYADITMSYSITKGNTQMLSFPVVKVGDNGRKSYYTPKEIAGFLEAATTVQVNSLMGVDGTFAYQDASNNWHGALRDINPSRGYYVNFAGSGVAALYAVTFTSSDATTSLNTGDYVDGEDYKINKLSSLQSSISYPFNSDEDWADVWGDPTGVYVSAVSCKIDASTTLTATYSGGWSGTLVDAGFKRGRGCTVTLTSVSPFPDRLELFKYDVGSLTSGGSGISRLLQESTGATGQDNQILTQIPLSTNISFMLFANDGSPNTQGVIDPYGMPIGKGSRIFAYDNSDDSNIFGTLLSDTFDDNYYPSLFTRFQGYQEMSFDGETEQVGIICMGDDGTVSGYDDSETVKYRCWESRSGRFFNVRWKDDSDSVISETFSNLQITYGTGGNLTTFTD